MKKVNFDKWKLASRTFKILYGTIYLVWMTGIFFQFAKSLEKSDFSMMYTYGQITLTLFGFTLVGGIFENRKPSPIVKKLFNSSILFLLTSMAFFIMYALSSYIMLDYAKLDLSGVMVLMAFAIAMCIGFFGMIVGFLNLFQILLDYRGTLEKKD